MWHSSRILAHASVDDQCPHFERQRLIVCSARRPWRIRPLSKCNHVNLGTRAQSPAAKEQHAQSCTQESRNHQSHEPTLGTVTRQRKVGGHILRNRRKKMYRSGNSSHVKTMLLFQKVRPSRRKALTMAVEWNLIEASCHESFFHPRSASPQTTDNFPKRCRFLF